MWWVQKAEYRAVMEAYAIEFGYCAIDLCSGAVTIERGMWHAVVALWCLLLLLQSLTLSKPVWRAARTSTLLVDGRYREEVDMSVCFGRTRLNLHGCCVCPGWSSSTCMRPHTAPATWAFAHIVHAIQALVGQPEYQWQLSVSSLYFSVAQAVRSRRCDISEYTAHLCHCELLEPPSPSPLRDRHSASRAAVRAGAECSAHGGPLAC